MAGQTTETENQVLKKLELVGASKAFSGIYALQDVDIELNAGEVHVLIGENGAGKSTLVKILSGVYQLDAGQLKINGKPVTLASPMDAIKRRIITIHQELMLVDHLTVAENIFLGKEHTRKSGFLNKKRMVEESAKLLAELKQDFSPLAKISDLGIAQKQMVEIAKALANNCQLLILDEPTATITNKEVEILFQTIERLKKQGVAMLYISHRLEELHQLGDRATILRNGQKVHSGPMKDLSIEDMIRHMIGRDLGQEFPTLPPPGEKEVLKVSNVNVPGKLKNAGFRLNQGEILGFYGLIGAGRTELMRTLFGLEHLTEGTFMLNGKPLEVKSPRKTMRQGIGLVPEDRKGQGLILERSVKENVSIASLDQLAHLGFLKKKKEAAMVQDCIREYAIKTHDQETKVLHLSGGNQQKVVIAKVMSTVPDIIIFDEPTRGIDVGAKQEVYRAMIELLEQGKSIIMVSSDLREMIGMSHRIIVMSNGAVTAEIPREQATQELILSHAFHVEQSS